jgi:uncharacterized protein
MIVTQCVPYVLNESITLNTLQSRLHGLDHWWRVWKNAQYIAKEPYSQPIDMEVVALYALFHDSMRQTDGSDRGHGDRGYKLFERLSLMLNLEQFLTELQTELLLEACLDHSSGHRSYDPTIAVCWDADRLDLHRKGIMPDPRMMSTEVGLDITVNRLRNPNGPKLELPPRENRP